MYNYVVIYVHSVHFFVLLRGKYTKYFCHCQVFTNLFYIMSINAVVLDQLKHRKNKNCIRALEDLHAKSFYTIKEWIKFDHPQLSTIDSINVISAYLNLNIEDIVVPDPKYLVELPQN